MLGLKFECTVEQAEIREQPTSTGKPFLRREVTLSQGYETQVCECKKIADYEALSKAIGKEATVIVTVRSYTTGKGEFRIAYDLLEVEHIEGETRKLAVA